MVLVGIDQQVSSLTYAPPSYIVHNDARELKIGYGWAVFSCVLTTVIALALRDSLAPANLVMLYLLAVVLITVRFGRKPGVLASFLAVLTFDLFLVPPYYSFTVAHTEYLLTFAIMLVVSLIISHLTANLRQQALIAHNRERRTHALFELSRDLSAALDYEQISEVGIRHLKKMSQAEVVFFLPNDKGQLSTIRAESWALSLPSDVVRRTAQQVFEQQASTTSIAADTTTSEGAIYLPLRAPTHTRGTLVVVPQSREQLLALEQEQLLQTCAAQIALALERVHYADVAQSVMVSIESERLRNSLLSAISHDVRTPLTAIVGLSSALSGPRPLTAETRQELTDAIQENAIRMSNLVTNLLDMARLNAGPVKLNKQWQMLEEVVGSSLTMLSRTLAERRIKVALPATLPLVDFDAVLMERVFCNLLDNAAKHTADNGHICITAEVTGKELLVAIEDDGAGIPKGMEEKIFGKFIRGKRESASPGVGLGLSICRTIIETHGGRIWAERRPGTGARFAFTLPLGCPPADADFNQSQPSDADL